MTEPFFNLYLLYSALANETFDKDSPQRAYNWAYLDGYADAMNLAYWTDEDKKRFARFTQNFFELHADQKLAKRASKRYRKEKKAITDE